MLPPLRRQDPFEAAPGHSSSKLSPVLSQMQAGSDHQRRSSENQKYQARRIDAELSPFTEMLCVFHSFPQEVHLHEKIYENTDHYKGGKRK